MCRDCRVFFYLNQTRFIGYYLAILFSFVVIYLMVDKTQTLLQVYWWIVLIVLLIVYGYGIQYYTVLRGKKWNATFKYNE